MSEIMNVWTELSTAIRRLKSSDSPDVWTSYANLVQARAEDFNTLLLALEAELAETKEELRLASGGAYTKALKESFARAEKAEAELWCRSLTFCTGNPPCKRHEVERLKAEIRECGYPGRQFVHRGERGGGREEVVK